MKITDQIKQDKILYSFEVFPPKKDSAVSTIYQTLDALQGLAPDYISVTYGAGGNTADKNTTEIAGHIRNKLSINSVAHLTCINSTKAMIDEILSDLTKIGVDNVLALRGDENPNIPPQKDFLYASDLIAYIKRKSELGISAACYPEGHPASDSLESDIGFLKQKVAAGAEHLVTQLVFDNEAYYRFYEKTLAAGIEVPISVGIMPVTNTKQIERMVTMCGVSLPAKFTRIMSRYENNPEALVDAGIAYAVDQIVDLIASGVRGIHLYTMNRPYVAESITESIRSLL